MQEAIKAHEGAGGYFFSQGALDFFTSNIYGETYQPETGLFITSESIGDGKDAPHVYAVRCVALDNPKEVKTFEGRYGTLREAQDRLELERREMLAGR